MKVKSFAVVSGLLVASAGFSGAADVQWVRVTALLEPGAETTIRTEQMMVPGGVYSLAEVGDKGIEAIDQEILERVRHLGESMRSVESSMRLASLAARQYYLRLELDKQVFLPVIDLNPRIGIALTAESFSTGNTACRVEFFQPEGVLDTSDFAGDPITVRLQDADLQKVLEVFARLTGNPISVDPSVTGTVTVDLVDVPWDQALDLVLRVNDLGWETVNGVVEVFPLDDYRRRRRVRTDAVINIPRTTWGSTTVASQGDEYSPTVVLVVESVEGPPRLVAELDGLVRPIHVELSQPTPETLENSLGELAVVRATVTTEGRLRDAEVLASPSTEYARGLMDVLARWRFRSVLDEQGRKQEAVIGVGFRFRQQRVLMSAGRGEHFGFEFKGYPGASAVRGTYIIEVKIINLESGEVVSQPVIRAIRGQETTVRSGLITRAGERRDLLLKAFVAEDGKTLRYSWSIEADGVVKGAHSAEFEL